MEGEDEIRKEYKRERIPWEKEEEEEEEEEEDCSNKNGACNHIQEIYTRTDHLLGLCQWWFSLN